MKDQYHLDASKISLKKFQKSLGSRELIPSRAILKENINERFNNLYSVGIHNLKDLIDALKTKQKLEAFSKLTSLSTDYLTLLKREANSYFPKPIRLSSFPGVESRTIKKLESIDIKNSKQLFNRARSISEKNQLSSLTKIPIEELTELFQLSDLARLYGVGPVFARLIHDVGIDSVKTFVKHSPKEIIKIYEDKTQKKADFSEQDIKFTLELAKEY